MAEGTGSSLRKLGTGSLDDWIKQAIDDPPAADAYDLAKICTSNTFYQANKLRLEMEELLERCTMLVLDIDTEFSLCAAISKYWPYTTEVNKTKVPYAFYYRLAGITESDAAYLRDRYVLAQGDIEGTDWLDVWDFAYLTEREAYKAYTWLAGMDQNLSFVTRAAEVFASWGQQSMNFLGAIRLVLEGNSPTQQDLLGVASNYISANRAKGGQAVARRQVRQCSLDLRKGIAKLTQYIGDSNQSFYEDHVDLVQGIEQSASVGAAGDNEARNIAVNTAFALHLQAHQDLLDDMARRQQLYQVEAQKLIDQITLRAIYRSIHKQLAKDGASTLSVRGTTTIEQADVPTTERLQHFSLINYIQPSADALKGAMKGSFGTPSTWNPFVTSYDPRLSTLNNYLVSLAWSPADGKTLLVHPDTIAQALLGIEETVTAGNLTALTDGTVTLLHTHPAGLITSVEEVTDFLKDMEVNHTYLANGDADGLVLFFLPTTAQVGDQVFVRGKGVGGWKIAQNEGQQIHFGTMNAIQGVEGYLEFTERYDCIELMCITEDNEWIVSGAVGNITINEEVI
jgi:hypothetical protein